MIDMRQFGNGNLRGSIGWSLVLTPISVIAYQALRQSGCRTAGRVLALDACACEDETNQQGGYPPDADLGAIGSNAHTGPFVAQLRGDLELSCPFHKYTFCFMSAIHCTLIHVDPNNANQILLANVLLHEFFHPQSRNRSRFKRQP
jgi:hypothetical protein